MGNLRVVVANELLAYREAIAAALQRFRPEATVVVTSPETLDDVVLRLKPHVVLCSRPSETVRHTAISWAVLYPDGLPTIIVCVNGEESRPPDVGVADLVEILDRTSGVLAVGDGVDAPATLHIAQSR